MDGYQMLGVCDGCGGLIDEEIPECSTCTCDAFEDYEDFPADDEPERCADCGKTFATCACSLNYPKAGLQP